MTVTISLRPEIEESLLNLAQARGVSLDRQILDILDREAANTTGQAGGSGKEKAEAFLAWAASFPDTEPLSDEAISRGTMYPDRW